ncbi:MAG: PTS sugar transporter subunit IIA [Victivallaceae bacterium]|nr:PTS sugar transporter subunit IIA [Victivallaceae bacterium]
MNEKEYLNIDEVAAKLNVSTETLERWVDNDRFPCIFEDGEPRFAVDEIETWMSTHLESAHERLSRAAAAVRTAPRPGNSLFELLSRGGIFYNVEGDLPGQAIANAMRLMQLPHNIDREQLIGALQEREKVFSTAIGHGVAIPHTRTPVIENEPDTRVGLFFLRSPVDFRALDREPVGTIFITLLADRKNHLRILQRIGYFCCQPDFMNLVRRRASREEIFEFLDVNRPMEG